MIEYKRTMMYVNLDKTCFDVFDIRITDPYSLHPSEDMQSIDFLSVAHCNKI